MQTAYRNRGLLYWEIGDNENALSDFYEAKRIAPEDAKIRALLGLGLQKVGRLDESVLEYTSVIS